MNAANTAQSTKPAVWMRVKDAAPAAGTSRQSLYRWVDAGLLPFRWVGREKHVDMAALRQLVAEREKNNPHHRRCAPPQLCSQGCGERVNAKGLCVTHYAQAFPTKASRAPSQTKEARVARQHKARRTQEVVMVTGELAQDILAAARLDRETPQQFMQQLFDAWLQARNEDEPR